MKWQAVIILFAIAFGIAVPPALPLTDAHDKQVTIGTLDVCHPAAPALSSDGEMPCLNECSSSPLPLALQEVIHIASLPDKSVFIVFQDERPPTRLA